MSTTSFIFRFFKTGKFLPTNVTKTTGKFGYEPFLLMSCNISNYFVIFQISIKKNTSMAQFIMPSVVNLQKFEIIRCKLNSGTPNLQETVCQGESVDLTMLKNSWELVFYNLRGQFSSPIILKLLWGTVVRALASHQCDPLRLRLGALARYDSLHVIDGPSIF